MLKLPKITLLQCDTVNRDRALYAQFECERHAEFGAVRLIDSGITDYKEYNRFIIQELSKEFTTDFVLTCQFDGFIVNGDAWTNEFLEYDYIGAPWDNLDKWDKYWPDKLMGNGGFSLRSKRFCEATAQLQNIEEDLAASDYLEDHVLCRMRRADLGDIGIRFAPPELAARFSWEKNRTYPKYKGAFGFHAKHTMMELPMFSNQWKAGWCMNCGSSTGGRFFRGGLLVCAICKET